MTDQMFAFGTKPTFLIAPAMSAFGEPRFAAVGAIGGSSTQAMVTHNQDFPNSGSRPYPKEWERRLLLPDGTHIFVRPVRPDDDELFRNFAKGLTEQDARQRFFVPKKELSDADLDRLVH